MSALELLLRTPVFAGAASSDLLPLASVGRFQQLARGQMLFSEGEPIEALHVVSLGSVRVYRQARRGARELTVHVEGSRQVVAGIAVFQQHASYPAHAQALESPTEVLSLPVCAVLDTVFTTPQLARAVIAFFARRQAALLDHIDRLVFSGLNERLAAYLLKHAIRPHDLPTNSELAALLGTVPELVSRKLGEFYRLGLIRLERRRVHIVDLAALQQWASGT